VGEGAKRTRTGEDAGIGPNVECITMNEEEQFGV